MVSDGYSQAEFGQALATILGKLTSGKSPTERPCGFLLVGQPGAGKTTLADIFTRQAEGNIIFVSGDEFRQFHPRYPELRRTYGDNAVLHTQEFSGKMTEAVIEALSKERYNLIIEGTLRTKEVPIRTKNLLEGRGYHVALAVVLVRPEISFLSTLKRYRMMQDFGAVPRMTPKAHHDMVCAVFPKNLSDLYMSKEFPDIRIFDRQENLLYDMRHEPWKNPADMVRHAWGRQLSFGEVRGIFREFGQHVPGETIERALISYGGFQSKGWQAERPMQRIRAREYDA